VFIVCPGGGGGENFSLANRGLQLELPWVLVQQSQALTLPHSVRGGFESYLCLYVALLVQWCMLTVDCEVCEKLAVPLMVY